MIEKLKNIKLTKKGIYISLAICMLVIGLVGIISAIRSSNKIVEEADGNYDKLQKLSGEIINPNFFEKEDEALSSGNETDKKDPTPVVLNFKMPVEGTVVKNHSGSELVYSETMNDYRTHCGIDISASDYATVYSCEAGEIISVENDPLWGTCVSVEHANGFITCYRNLNSQLPVGVEVGAFVQSGGIIGNVGSSALVEVGEASHLHLEMYVNGASVDPNEYIL